MPAVQAIGRLGEVAEQDWNSLVGDHGFYLSYDWLRYVESEQAEEARYLIARRAGIPCGALTLYRVLRSPNVRYRPEHFKELLGIDGQALIAGACRGYRSTLLLPPAPDRRETLTSLLQRACQDAAAQGYAGLVLPFLTTPALLDVAEVATVRAAFDLPEAQLTDCDQGLSGYTGRLRKSARTKIRVDRRQFTAAGWTVRERSLNDCWREAAGLLYQLERKHGHTHRTREQLEAQLAGQVKYLADSSLVVTCEDEQGIAGLCVLYRWRDALFARMSGFDYDRLRDGHEYFTVAMYTPIEYAARKGLTHVYLGPGSWEAKAHRGAILRPLWNAFVPADAAPGESGIDLVNPDAVSQFTATIASRHLYTRPGEWDLTG